MRRIADTGGGEFVRANQGDSLEVTILRAIFDDSHACVSASRGLRDAASDLCHRLRSHHHQRSKRGSTAPCDSCVLAYAACLR